MRREIMPAAALLAGLALLAGCAPEPRDDGPLSPVGDISASAPDRSQGFSGQSFGGGPGGGGIGGGAGAPPMAPDGAPPDSLGTNGINADGSGSVSVGTSSGL